MYSVLDSSLRTAIGVMTVVLWETMCRVHEECGAMEKTVNGIYSITTVAMCLVVVVLSGTCLPR